MKGQYERTLNLKDKLTDINIVCYEQEGGRCVLTCRKHFLKDDEI